MIRVVTIGSGSYSADGFADIALTGENIAWVGHNAGIESAVELCTACQPDVVLLTICNSNGESLQTVQKLRTSNSQMKLIIFSPSRDVDFIRDLMKIGISGYLLEYEDRVSIADLIHTVKTGHFVCSTEIARTLFQRPAQR